MYEPFSIDFFHGVVARRAQSSQPEDLVPSAGGTQTSYEEVSLSDGSSPTVSVLDPGNISIISISDEPDARPHNSGEEDGGSALDSTTYDPFYPENGPIAHRMQARFMQAATVAKFGVRVHQAPNGHRYAVNGDVSRDVGQNMAVAQYLFEEVQQPPQPTPLPDVTASLVAQALQKVGIARLRPPQELAISNILRKQDQLVSIPTAGGKSLIYTLPALIFNKISVVIVPTVALRRDQIK